MAAAGAGEGDAFVWVDVGAGAFYNPDTRKYDIGSHHSRTGSDMGDYYNKARLCLANGGLTRSELKGRGGCM